MATEKIPPVNIEAEEEVLGGLIFQPEVVYDVMPILPEEAFYSNQHRIIYRAIIDLAATNKACDFINICEWLSARGHLEDSGGSAKIAHLLNRTVSATNIDRYTNLILDKYIRRRIIASGDRITEIGYDSTKQVEASIEAVEDIVFNISPKEYENFEPEEAAISMQEVFDRMYLTESKGISTKILDLDAKIGGLKDKNLYILAARASMGKTWLACNIAKAVAKQGKRVVFFSAEMSKNEISSRLLAMESGVSSDKFDNGESTDEDRNRVAAILRDMIELPITLDDSPARLLTPSIMRSKLRKTAIKHSKPDLVILDYIQKLGDRSAGNRAQVVGKIAGELKDLAKEFDVPVLCLAQINRGTDSRSDKRPIMSDIKDSGDIEQDADVIITLYRDEYYYPDSLDRGLIEINVAKNRNGQIGVCKCLFNPAIGEIKNLKEFVQGI